MKGTRLLRRGRLVAAIVLTGLGLAMAGYAPSAGAQDPTGAVTRTEKVARTHLNPDGSESAAGTNSITLHVGQTRNLRGRQQVAVSWSGAHPTGGVWPDENSSDAAKEEYPFVLLQCRGVDSVAAPLAPTTCWTQTWAERFQADYGNQFPVWRIDRYAAAADRTEFAEQPNPMPTGCLGGTAAERWVPFAAVTGRVYQGGAQGCAGMAPESANVGGGALPSNATYGITLADGSGSAMFDVWTTDENASLGCSYQVACSLVAIPITGLSCDVAAHSLPPEDQPPSADAPADDAACRASGQYQPGEPASTGIPPDLSVTGSLWWSASNWRNRISVPLSFAQPSSVCDVVSSGKRVSIYGSELMAEATGQWAPAFCTDPKLFKFTHVQTAEPEARSLLVNGSIDAAFTSMPPDGGFGRPVVQAPVAVTGFAISYAVDDAKGASYHSLRLNPRLLAKLLTESYPAEPLVTGNYKALAKNPLNITLDPEFVALNPGIPASPGNPTASVLLALSSDSDVIWALTSYINADPEARAWLNGSPDPWGMVVNPAYRKIALPVTRWALADRFLLPKTYIDSQLNPCYSASPTPYLGLVANPVGALATSAQRIEFALSNVDTDCPNGIPGDLPTLKLSTLGRQQPGHRFMLALTSLGEVYRYQLEPAQLQTASTPSRGKFTKAVGRSFAGPTPAALQTAATSLQPDSSTETWPVSYTRLRNFAAAYPGTMVVYADVPTTGLSQTEAAELATLLRFAATTGQTPGLTNGHLPGGYLPITKADGLAKLAAYTTAAAGAVAAQEGTLPSVTGQTPPPAPTPRTSSYPVAPGPAAPPPAQPVASNPVGTASAVPARPVPSQYPTAVRTTIAAGPQARTVAVTSSLAGGAVPTIVVIGLFCALASAALRILPRLRAPNVRTRR